MSQEGSGYELVWLIIGKLVSCKLFFDKLVVWLVGV